MRVCLLLCFCLTVQVAFAQRPKIGLALAGGGAKGSAHIAVLQVLEANNIPVDYIAGTSIGAYVGGLYALGYSAAEIETIMFEADFNRGYSDAITRDVQFFRTKQQNDRFNLPFEMGLRAGAVQTGSGLLQGQTMSELYRASVGAIARINSFDDLPIPFRAVATDLVTSQAVILDRGDLVKVMQASSTVPGALAPSAIDGRLLVDGGLSNNLPIGLVKEMGADIVIAVDISAVLSTQANLQNTVSVVRQITAFLTNRSVEEERARLSPQDIYIRPQIDQMSTTDFSVLPRAFAAGSEAAQAELEALQRLSLSDSDYQEYVAAKLNQSSVLRLQEQQLVSSVVLQNRSSINDDYIREVLALEAGSPLSSDELLDGIQRVYALGFFERVDAEFVQVPAGRQLVVYTNEKSWGPNYIDFGIGWEDDFGLDSSINLDAALTLGNLTANGGELRTELGMGTDKRLNTEFYLPLDNKRRFFSSTKYEYNRSSRDSFVDNQRALTVDVRSHELNTGVGYNFVTAGMVEAGFSIAEGKISNDVLLANALKFSTAGPYIKFGYDTLDRISFPTSGNRVTLKLSQLTEDLGNSAPAGSNSNYRSTQLDANWKGAMSLGRHSLTAKATFTSLSTGADSSINLVQLGGFLNLSGYHKNALLGNQRFFTSLAYHYSLNSSLFGMANFPLYMGTSIETGNVWLASESMTVDDLLVAGSVYFATDTSMGPVAIGFGKAEGNKRSVYFYLGKNF